jgi:hypothetical protein
MPWARIVATRMSVIFNCDGSDERRTAFSIVPVRDILPAFHCDQENRARPP